MANLLELFDNVVEFQNYNGVPLAAGKLYVYALGRTRLMDTWSDIDGESLNPNPIILDDLGQCHCYVSDAFDYTLVVCDQFDNEIFSVDKYLLSKGEHSHADVAVAPSEHIGVSSYHVGEVTVYVPYLTGEVGKVYEGIDPIVVNNDVNRISANHIPLGVQDPLYFVEDSETACVIGIDSSACGKTYSGISPILVDNTANTISITGDIGKDWTEEILSAANDASAAATAWTDSQGYLTGVDLSEYAKESFVISAIDSSTSGLLPTSAYATASGSFITALPADLATTGFVADVSADITAMIPTALTGDYLTKESADTLYQSIGNYLSSTDSANFLLTSDSGNFYTTDNPSGFITGVDIPESANWNSTYNTVHDNSATWTGSTANPQIPVTGINGIKISESGDKVVFEVSGDYYPGDNPSGFITGVDLSDYATTAQVSEKLDTTAFSDVSGTFLTAHQDLSDYQTTAGMTAYMSTADSANFYTTANESGFVTSGELPDPVIIGFQEGDTLDTDYDGLKIVKATANGNEHINLHKKSTDQWLIHGNLVPTSPGSNKYLITDDSGAMHWDNKSALAYDSAFEQSGGYITAYNGSAFKAGDEFPQSATEAIETVTANSADWNGTTETVSSNSGAWGGSALPISAGPGIALNLVDGVLVISTAGE